MNEDVDMDVSSGLIDNDDPILAKVTRDRLMLELGSEYDVYNFKKQIRIHFYTKSPQGNSRILSKTVGFFVSIKYFFQKSSIILG